MTLGSEKSSTQNLSLEGFSQSRMIDTAADWLNKEVYRANLIANNKSESASLMGKSLFATLLELITGSVSERFMDPLTHQTLQERMKNPVFQSFIYGRLGKLAMLEEFSRKNNDKLFDMVIHTNVTPWILPGESTEGLSQIYEATTPDVDALRLVFKNHHWILLLIFVINSYQLKGFDNNLLT